MVDLIKKYGALASLLVLIVGATIGSYEFFAHQSDMEAFAAEVKQSIEKTNIRIDNRILNDLLRNVCNDLNVLYDKHRTNICYQMSDTYDKQKCSKLQQQKSDLERKIDILREKELE